MARLSPPAEQYIDRLRSPATCVACPAPSLLRSPDKGDIKTGGEARIVCRIRGRGLTSVCASRVCQRHDGLDGLFDFVGIGVEMRRKADTPAALGAHDPVLHEARVQC